MEVPPPAGGRPPERPPASRRRGFSFVVARAIVWLRWPILLLWVLGAGAAWIFLPSTSHLPTAGIYALVPQNTPAFAAIHEESKLFRTSLLPQIVAVQRNPHHLSPAAQASIVQTAVKLDRRGLPGLPKGAIAVPVLNTLPYLLTARETSTTAITYLGFPSKISFPTQNTYARMYARRVSVPGAPAELTGLVPGTLEEASAIDSHLRYVEIATIVMIILIIGLYMRSVLAPAITIVSAAILYLVSTRVVTWFANRVGIQLHKEVEPIVVVLLLGVITDYSVFFLSGLRDRLLAGEQRLEASRDVTARFLPIILTAGLIVCAGLATLEVASIGFVKALGPGLAIVVFITLALALTFVPAAMAVTGKYLLWPGRRGDVRDRTAGQSRGARFRRGLAHALSKRWAAACVTALVAAVLCACASGLFRTQVGMTPIRGLPSSSPAHHALDEASQGFSPGIVAPTEVMVRHRGIGRRRPALTLLGRELARTPGVSAVVGAGIPGIPRRYDVFRARTGDAARYLVVFDHTPFSPAAVDDLSRLEQRAPGALRSSGLANGTAVYYAGDTPIARDAFRKIYHDLALVAATVFAVNFILLAIFLRSLVAPFYLVAASALSLAATFGVTTYVFQDLLGYDALTYYIPLAGGVLLVAFGSDYNLFVIGRIWQESERRLPDEAVERAAPRASRAISVAGLALALSFGMLAIVPVRPFRELGFAIGFGVLLDTFLVRSLLLPSLVTLAGRTSWWPSNRGRRAQATSLS